MNSVENQKYIDLLIQTLQKQEKTLQEVLEITKQQNEIANSDDFDELQLEPSLNQKDILIARLNELDDGFASVYGRVRNAIGGNQDAYKKELDLMQQLIRSCTDLGNEIKVMEERNKEKLTKRFAQKHKQYSAKQTAATVASKYHRTMHSKMGSGSSFST